MFTLLRRLFWLGFLGGAGYAGWSMWQRRDAPTPAAAPEWPPMPAATPATDAPPEPTRAEAAAPAAAPATMPNADAPPDRSRLWADPIDGACPDGYPIKANANSGIYHVPGGRFYDRTVPERCYADRADAEADGYRAAKA